MLDKILNVVFKVLSIFCGFSAGCLFTYMVEVMKEFNVTLFLGFIGGLTVALVWGLGTVTNTKEKNNK